MRLLLAILLAAGVPHLEHVPLGHGVVYVHPPGRSSRVPCSSPRAAVWDSYDQTVPSAGPEWHINICFTGGYVPYEAILSHGNVECVWRMRIVTHLSDCT